VQTPVLAPELNQTDQHTFCKTPFGGWLPFDGDQNKEGELDT
jgi:hypothetical protein